MGFLSMFEVVTLPFAAKALQLAFGVFAMLHLFSGDYPEEISVHNNQHFDVIIVGGGSAGCVVANRLSEIDNMTVALIEGGDDPRVDALLPGLFLFIAYSNAEWNFFSVNDKYSSQAHKAKRIHYALGKMLGGSSGTNYMYYVRGNKKDYAEWVALGNPGWDWKTVLYYFKKSERMTSAAIVNGRTGHLHNTKGLLGVSRPNWGEESTKYLNAFKQNGHKINVDNNDIKQLGYSQPCFTIDEPWRQNTAFAFLKPIKDRKKLFILKNSYVRKVLFDGNKRAIGVEVKVHNENIIHLKANKEVILSAGAINSPHILMASGIGPKEHLEDKGVKVILNSPHVGKHLKDHVAVMVTLTAEKNPISALENAEVLTNLDKFPTPSIMGFAALNKSDPDAVPDYQVIAFPFPAAALGGTLICSHVFRYEDNICEKVAEAGQTRETFFALVDMLHPKSEGRVKLKSSDPEDDPEIHTGYFTHKEDLEKHARCMEDYISVLKTAFFKNVDGQIGDYGIKQCKHLTFASHEYWKCHVLNLAQTLWHLVGTCAMGPEGKGVVDERLRVRGVTGLRVIDGSVIPSLTSGNTNAPIIMVAERGSDLFKEDHGLPVERVIFG